MIITKEKLKKHIDDFPDEISIEEVIERLIFIEKLLNFTWFQSYYYN